MKLETSQELLERLRARQGGVSYYRISQILDVAQSAVLRWKDGKGGMAREYAPRVAELLGEPAEYILACIESEREPSAAVRRLWKNIAEAFRSKAAIILIGALGLSPAPAPVPAQALASTVPQLSASPDIHYANPRHRRRRRLADRLIGWLLWTPRPAPAWGRV